MSIRHYASEFDDLDDLTYRMLDSRFCKVAMHGQRHDALRHRREHEQVDHPTPRKPRRPRELRPRDEHGRDE